MRARDARGAGQPQRDTWRAAGAVRYANRGRPRAGEKRNPRVRSTYLCVFTVFQARFFFM